MRLLGRAKIFLDAKVNLCSPGGEPAASARGQRLWLADLHHFEYIAIKTARDSFAPWRHGELHVVKT